MQRSTVHMMMFTLHRNRTRQPHLPTFLESLNLLLILDANNATPTQDQKNLLSQTLQSFGILWASAGEPSASAWPETLDNKTQNVPTNHFETM